VTAPVEETLCGHTCILIVVIYRCRHTMFYRGFAKQ